MSKIIIALYNWVMGNGPRDEDEDHAPEPAPNLPFAWVPLVKKTRFHEATIRERLPEWLEHQGTGLFSSMYAGLSILTCVLLISLLVQTSSGLPSSPSLPESVTSVTSVATETGDTTGATGVTGETSATNRPEFSSEHLRPRVMGVPLVLFAAFTGIRVLYGPRKHLSFLGFGSDWGVFSSARPDAPRFSGRILTSTALFLIGSVTLALGGVPFALGFAAAAVMTNALLFYPGLHSSFKGAITRVPSFAIAAAVLAVAFTDFVTAFAPAFTPGLAQSGTSVSLVSAVSVVCACGCSAAALYGICLMFAAPDARD